MLGTCWTLVWWYVCSWWFDALSLEPITTWGTSCNDCWYSCALLWHNVTELWLQLLLLWLLSLKIVCHFGNMCCVRKSGKVLFLLNLFELCVQGIPMYLSTWKFTGYITEIFFIIRDVHRCIEMSMTSCWGVLWDFEFILWTSILVI